MTGAACMSYNPTPPKSVELNLGVQISELVWMRLVRTHVVQNKGNFFCSFEAKRFVLERFRVWKKIHSIRHLSVSLSPPSRRKVSEACSSVSRPSKAGPFEPLLEPFTCLGEKRLRNPV